MTLGRGIGLWVHVDGIVGARLQARLAADARALVKLNNAVRTLVHGGDGADARTGRILAVVAARHLKVAAAVRVLARFHILDPRAVDAQRHFVFRFASSGTGVTTNTLAVVDDKS